MKQIKFLILAAILPTLALTGCDKSNGGDDEKEYSAIVDFESAQLEMQAGKYSPKYDNVLFGASRTTLVNDNNVFEGIIYSEDGLSFGSTYNDYASYGSAGDYWGGFAISSNNNLEDLGYDYSNQFSAYASSVSKYAIGYDIWYSEYYSAAYDKPTIVFETPKTIFSARIANANKAYHYCVSNPNGSSGETPISFKLIVKGFNDGKETQTVSVVLAEGTNVLSGWKEVDFTSLGEVDKIEFSFESNDVNAMGNLVPAYFCIDDIKIK